MDEQFEKSYFRPNWKQLVSAENKLIRELRYPDESKEYKFFTNPSKDKRIW